MIDGNKLGSVGFEKIGTPYSEMDCQAFVEWCLRKCGCNKDLAGSNAWYREVMKHGAVMTPEECVKQLGKVPDGAFLFILLHDGREPEKYREDGIGNASHIGLCTGTRGKGAIASSSSRGCVAESEFHGRTIKNGGWNMVGLWDQVSYDYGSGGGGGEPIPSWRPTIRRGSRGADVKYCQQMLMDRGYDLSPYNDDGDFGRKTEAAVIAFQQAHGLIADGVVGPMTLDALEADQPAEEKYTVTIQHMTKAEAEMIRNVYPDAEIRKEG